LNYYIPISVIPWHEVKTDLSKEIFMNDMSYGYLPVYLTLEELRKEYETEEFIMIDGPDISKVIN